MKTNASYSGNAPTVHDYLKQKTEGLHRRLELLMAADSIMDRTISLRAYKKLLEINYAVLVKLEEPLFSELAKLPQLNLAERRKLPLLTKDLEELASVTNNISTPYSLPAPLAINGIPAALGALYVLEGATLGGTVIAKQLRAIPELSQYSFHFYSAYGNNTGKNWKDFLSILNAQCTASADYEDCVEGANLVFSSFICAAQLPAIT